MSISDSAVRQVLTAYRCTIGPDCPELRVVPAGFSGAVVWKAVAADQQWAIRRWPPAMRDAARLRQLHRLLAAIQPLLSFHSPVPVPNDQGATFMDHAGTLWQCEPWVKGQPIDSQAASSGQLAAIMKSLAEWHWAAAKAVSELPSSVDSRFSVGRGIPDSVQHRISRLQQWSPDVAASMLARLKHPDWLSAESGSELLQRLSEHVQFYQQTRSLGLDRLQQVALPTWLQPCLRDVWSDHVLLHQGRVTGLIDAAAASTDTIATDIARLVSSLAGSNSTIWRTCWFAYRQHRLSLENRGVAPISPPEKFQPESGGGPNWELELGEQGVQGEYGAENCGVAPILGAENSGVAPIPKLIQALDLANVLLSPLVWMTRLASDSPFAAAQLVRIERRVTHFVTRHAHFVQSGRLGSEPST